MGRAGGERVSVERGMRRDNEGRREGEGRDATTAPRSACRKLLSCLQTAGLPASRPCRTGRSWVFGVFRVKLGVGGIVVGSGPCQGKRLPCRGQDEGRKPFPPFSRLVLGLGRGGRALGRSELGGFRGGGRAPSARDNADGNFGRRRGRWRGRRGDSGNRGREGVAEGDAFGLHVRQAENVLQGRPPLRIGR